MVNTWEAGQMIPFLLLCSLWLPLKFCFQRSPPVLCKTPASSALCTSSDRRVWDVTYATEGFVSDARDLFLHRRWCFWSHWRSPAVNPDCLLTRLSNPPLWLRIGDLFCWGPLLGHGRAPFRGGGTFKNLITLPGSQENLPLGWRCRLDTDSR